MNYSPMQPRHLKPVLDSKCKSCQSLQIVVDNGEYVCKSCGRVQGPTYDQNTSTRFLGNNSNGYKRIFYFNERISRWCCCEPRIAPDIWEVIHAEAVTKLPDGNDKYPEVRSKCNRSLVGKILRNVTIDPILAEKHRSKKFKLQPLTKKRFYDKYYEKWKTIRWKLTGQTPIRPSHQLVETVKTLFLALQEPFEIFKHHESCDGRKQCQKYFNCVHNFMNYDYVFRICLQIAEKRYGFYNSYELFKEEFTLPGKKIVHQKLRPLMSKICAYNGWEMPLLD